MALSHLEFSIDHEFASEVRSRADAEGITVEDWLGRAVEREIRHLRLGELLDREAAECGPITAQEREDVERVWPASR